MSASRAGLKNAALKVLNEIPADSTPWRELGFPRICASGRQLRETSGEALAALQCANDPLSLFTRSGSLVQIVVNEKGRKVISPVGENALRGRLTRSADYYRVNHKGKESDCAPPMDVVKDMLAMAPNEWKFPPLQTLTEIPVIRPDGTILDAPGYDWNTGFYYAPDPDLKIPAIEQSPTADDLDGARGLIEEVFCDFPFVDQASKANAIAGLITSIVKSAIAAPSPIQLNDAPAAGSGKSLGAEVQSIIVTGRNAEMFSAPADPDEWRKAITTALLAGTAVVVFDNVTRQLDSPDLCKVLTANLYADRAFKTQDKILLAVTPVFIATGNNMRLGGDMPRRCYRVQLNAKQPRPFLRSTEDFKHPKLLEWVKEHRGELLAALLTMARAWYMAGKPKPKVKPLGGFEAWTVTVGGILEHAGIEGFLANATQLYEEADTESIEWESFLTTLHEVFYGDAFTTAELVDLLAAKTWNADTRMNEHTDRAAKLRAVMPDYLAEVVDKDAFRRRAGRCFSERLERRFGDRHIHLKRGTINQGAQQWVVVIPGGNS